MRKAKFRELSDLILLISQSREGGLGDFSVGLAVRAVTLNHIAFTHLPSILPILFWALLKASFETLDFGFQIPYMK